MSNNSMRSDNEVSENLRSSVSIADELMLHGKLITVPELLHIPDHDMTSEVHNVSSVAIDNRHSNSNSKSNSKSKAIGGKSKCNVSEIFGCRSGQDREQVQCVGDFGCRS